MTTLRNIGFSLLAAAALALPASAKAKAKADVTCSDGTTSKAGRGACSHHGGVAGKSAPATKAEKSASAKSKADADTSAKADEKKPEEKKSSGGILGSLFGKRSDSAQGRSSSASPRSSTRDAKSGTPTARCKDGTTSYSAHRSGTCSNHGGVAEWLGK